MPLPAAVALALWGTHFLRGSTSPDSVIDHCGATSLPLLSTVKGAEQIELVLVTDGDLGQVQTDHWQELLSSGSALLVGERLFLAPDWVEVRATRAAPPTRTEAERLLIDAITEAALHFSSSPAIGATPPEVMEIEFPPQHPPKLRELLSRSLITDSIANHLQNSWTATKADLQTAEAIIRQMKYASRRGLEASVIL